MNNRGLDPESIPLSGANFLWYKCPACNRSIGNSEPSNHTKEHGMAFKSWQSFWEFSSDIMYNSRYIYSQQTQEFLEEVLISSASRQELLFLGQKLWRAQLGGEWYEVRDDDGNVIDERLRPYPKERMYPLKKSAVEGRVNAKGIPCLYLSSDHITAMSECRPWVGSEISIAEFKVLHSMKIVDCSANLGSIPLYFCLSNWSYEPSDLEKEEAVWTCLNRAFSHPVVPDESKAHYAPTQVIAEMFKAKGYDGIKYKSSLGEGCNYALFCHESVTLDKLAIFTAKSMKINFEQA